LDRGSSVSEKIAHQRARQGGRPKPMPASRARLIPTSGGPFTTVRDTTPNLGHFTSGEDQLGALGCWFDVHFAAV